jgi:pyruvate,water dikinase
MRERARGKQALLYRRLRDVALALGAAMVREGLLKQADDAVYFSLEELGDLAAGTALQPSGAAGVAAVRRAEHTRQADVRPPSAFSLPEGEVWIGSEEEAADTSRLDGAGACAGVITGRAVVLTDLADAGEVSPGDILVTRQTDPGWAPLFPLISGLVVERGGLLSHGAILAREYGLPTVVGVPGVTGALKTGQKIRVDGGRGHVRIVDE